MRKSLGPERHTSQNGGIQNWQERIGSENTAQLTIGRFLNVLRTFQVRSMDVLSKRLENVLLWKVLDVNKTFQMDV